MIKATEKDEKKWSRLFDQNSIKLAEETKQTVESSMTNAVKTNQFELMNKAVNKSQEIQRKNHIERERRKTNILIRNIAESTKEKKSEKIEDNREFVTDLLEELDVRPNEILSLWRLVGK